MKTNNSVHINLDLSKEYITCKDKKKKLLKFVFLIMKWNEKFNIISMKDPKNIIKKHIIDSLSLIKHLKKGDILDIGSGAGFPSVPIAIYREKQNFFLLESKIKKTSFIRYIVSILKINNIFIFHTRLENFDINQHFSYIVSRAFVDLKNFIAFFRKSLLKECVIIIMNSHLNVGVIKKFFTNKTSEIKIVNITKFSNKMGHRNLIFFKINKKVNKLKKSNGR